MKVLEGFKKMIIVIAIAVPFLIVLSLVTKYFTDLAFYRDSMENITIDNVNFKTLRDGKYSGTYDAIMVSASVIVKVTGGKVVTIDVTKNKYEKGISAISIVKRIIDSQSLNVELVTGAKEDSKAILKAVEKALRSEPSTN